MALHARCIIRYRVGECLDSMTGYAATYLYFFAVGMGAITGFAFAAILYWKK